MGNAEQDGAAQAAGLRERRRVPAKEDGGRLELAKDARGPGLAASRRATVVQRLIILTLAGIAASTFVLLLIHEAPLVLRMMGYAEDAPADGRAASRAGLAPGRAPSDGEQLRMRHDIMNSTFHLDLGGEEAVAIRAHGAADGAGRERPPAIFYDHVVFGITYFDERLSEEENEDRAEVLAGDIGTVEPPPARISRFRRTVRRNRGGRDTVEDAGGGYALFYPLAPFQAMVADEADRGRAAAIIEGAIDALRRPLIKVARERQLYTVMEWYPQLWGEGAGRHTAIVFELKPIFSGLRRMRGAATVWAG